MFDKSENKDLNEAKNEDNQQRFQESIGYKNMEEDEKLSELSFIKEDSKKIQTEYKHKQVYKHFVEQFQDENIDEMQYGQSLNNQEEYKRMLEQSEFDLALQYIEEFEIQRNKTQQQIYLDVVEMNDLEKVQTYTDKLPFLGPRKKVLTYKVKISNLAFAIIKNPIFEFITLIIIVFNSVMLALDDPTQDTKDPILQTIDLVFLILYTIEMGLKIIGLGFLLSKNAYLRDTWNILDFIIVTTAYLPYLFDTSSGVNLSSLRSLRVLRPLRTITSVKALKNILKALFSAMRLLLDSIIILIFFFMVFAIGGVQLFQGILKKRCINPEVGLIYTNPLGSSGDTQPMCASDGDCGIYNTISTSYVCAKMMENPNYGITNFDTFGWSFLQIFQIITLEGWSDIMYYVMKTFSPLFAIYFVLVVFLGAFFLLNLTLAIIKSKFTEQQDKDKQEKEPKEQNEKEQQEISFDLDKFKRWGIYISQKDRVQYRVRRSLSKKKSFIEQLSDYWSAKPRNSQNAGESIIGDNSQKVFPYSTEQDQYYQVSTPQNQFFGEKRNQFQRKKSMRVDRRASKATFLQKEFQQQVQGMAPSPVAFGNQSPLGVGSNALLLQQVERSNKKNLSRKASIKLPRASVRFTDQAVAILQENAKKRQNTGAAVAVVEEVDQEEATDRERVKNPQQQQQQETNISKSNIFQKAKINLKNIAPLRIMAKFIGRSSNYKLEAGQNNNNTSGNTSNLGTNEQQRSKLIAQAQVVNNNRSALRNNQLEQEDEEFIDNFKMDAQNNNQTQVQPSQNIDNNEGNLFDISIDQMKQLSGEKLKANRENKGNNTNNINLNQSQQQSKMSFDSKICSINLQSQFKSMSIPKPPSGIDSVAVQIDQNDLKNTQMLQQCFSSSQSSQNEKQTKNDKSTTVHHQNSGSNSDLSQFILSPTNSSKSNIDQNKFEQSELPFSAKQIKNQMSQKNKFNQSNGTSKEEQTNGNERILKRQQSDNIEVELSDNQNKQRLQKRPTLSISNKEQSISQGQGQSQSGQQVEKNQTLKRMLSKKKSLTVTLQQQHQTQRQNSISINQEEQKDGPGTLVIADKKKDNINQMVGMVKEFKRRLSRKSSFKQITKILSQQQQQQPQATQNEENKSNTVLLTNNLQTQPLQGLSPTSRPSRTGQNQEQQQHIARKSVLLKKRLSRVFQRQDSRKITQLANQNNDAADQRDREEAEKYRPFYDPLYMKARVIYEPYQQTSLDDVLPSKKLREEQQRKEQEELIIKNKKFKLNYTFESQFTHKILQHLIQNNQLERLNFLREKIKVKKTKNLLNNISKEQELNNNQMNNFNLCPISQNSTAQEVVLQNLDIFPKSSNFNIKRKTNVFIKLRNKQQNALMFMSTVKSAGTGGKNVTHNKNKKKKDKENANNSFPFHGWSSLRAMNELFVREPFESELLEQQYGLIHYQSILRKREAAPQNPNSKETQENTNGVNNNTQQKAVNSSSNNILQSAGTNKQDPNHNPTAAADNKDKPAIAATTATQPPLAQKKQSEFDSVEQKMLQEQHEDAEEKEIQNEYSQQLMKILSQPESSELQGAALIDARWSGEEVKFIQSIQKINQVVLTDKQISHLYKILNQLNFSNEDLEQWEGGIGGLIEAFRRLIKRFALSKPVDNIMMLCVFINTVILALDGLVDKSGDAILNQFNVSFTIIFTVDMGLKIIGMGLIEYLRDKMNIFDCSIVILSLSELVIFGSGGGSAISAFRSVRIFRTFRVLRVTRLIRSLHYMKIIMDVIINNITSFVYILLLLMLFLYIYALLGMQLFGGQFNFKDGHPRLNFDTFYMSFMAVWDILTMENWNNILFYSLRSGVMKVLSLLFLVSWIFMGNYVLLNLFLAILLDGFSEEQKGEDIKELEEDFLIGENLKIENNQEGGKDNDPGNSQAASVFFQHKQNLATNHSPIGPQRLPNNQNVIIMRNNEDFRQMFLQPSQNNQMNQTQQSVAAINKSANNINASNANIKSNNKNETSQISLSQAHQLSSKTKHQKSGISQDNFNDSQISPSSHENGENKQFYYFEGISCEMALFLFSKENLIRRQIYWVVKHHNFEFVILIFIIISSLKLVFDTYISEDDPDQQYLVIISNYMDVVFTVIFTIEALMKTIAFGFVLNKNSYLRDSWSQLDFFIVVASLIDLSIDSINLSFFRILRLLRTLRPLRFISHNNDIKFVVTALLESFSAITNVAIVIILIMIMFAILGINIQKGKMHYCQLPSGSKLTIYDVASEQDCALINGAIWSNYDLNFDDIVQSLVFLYILNTQEGWPDYVWLFVDGTENGPVLDNSQLFMIYFVAYLFVGSMFLINLFVGVIFLNYHIAISKAKNEFLTDGQARWIEIQRLIVKSKPDYLSIRPPNNAFRRQLWRFSESSFLETFVLICIILNIVTMAMSYEGATPQYDLILKYINLFFTSVFISEAAIKLIAYNPRGYFYNGWNKFDFFVVATSILDIILDFLGKSFISFLKVGPQLARIFRVLRVSRLLRLIKSFQGLQKLIQVAVFALPSLLNVTALLGLIYFIFAILGVFLYKNIKQGTVIGINSSFSNFSEALILLFQCSTGENWYLVMFDTVHGLNNYLSVFYFIFFILIVRFIMLNLFILIILQQFEDNFLNEDNPISNFEERESNFKKLWIKMTIENRGIKMKDKDISEFYLQLEEPLGMNWNRIKQEFIEKIKEHYTPTELKLNQEIEKEHFQQKTIAGKKIMQMNIMCDQDNFIFFNELLFYLMRSNMQKNIEERVGNDQTYEEAMKIIKKEEQNTQLQIQKLKLQHSSHYTKRLNNNQQGQQCVNPLVKMLFVQMCFRSWRRFSDNWHEKMKDNKDNSDVFSSTESDDASDSSNSDSYEDSQQPSEQTANDDKFNKKKLASEKKSHIIPRQRHNTRLRTSHVMNENNLMNVFLPNTDIYKDDDVDQNEFAGTLPNRSSQHIEYIKRESIPRNSQIQKRSIIANSLNNITSILSNGQLGQFQQTQDHTNNNPKHTSILLEKNSSGSPNKISSQQQQQPKYEISINTNN